MQQCLPSKNEDAADAFGDGDGDETDRRFGEESPRSSSLLFGLRLTSRRTEPGGLRDDDDDEDEAVGDPRSPPPPPRPPPTEGDSSDDRVKCGHKPSYVAAISLAIGIPALLLICSGVLIACDSEV